MDIKALFNPPLLLNPSPDDAARSALTSPLLASVFHKYTDRLRVMWENDRTAQNLRGGQPLDSGFIFRQHLPYIAVWGCDRGRYLAKTLSDDVVTGHRDTPV